MRESFQPDSSLAELDLLWKHSKLTLSRAPCVCCLDGDGGDKAAEAECVVTLRVSPRGVLLHRPGLSLRLPMVLIRSQKTSAVA